MRALLLGRFRRCNLALHLLQHGHVHCIERTLKGRYAERNDSARKAAAVGEVDGRPRRRSPPSPIFGILPLLVLHTGNEKVLKGTGGFQHGRRRIVAELLHEGVAHGGEYYT